MPENKLRAVPLREEHFAFADALRATAISVVVLSHIAQQIFPYSTVKYGTWAMGGWGVAVFFVLSGFLLSRPYLEATLRLRPMPRVGLYFRRRFLRIWPAYAVAVVLSAGAARLLCHCTSATGLRDVAAHLAMVHNVFPKYVWGAGNAALWTMAPDSQFYVVLPLAAMALYKLSNRDVVRTQRIAVGALLGAIVLSLAWRLILRYFFPALTSDALVDTFERGFPGMVFCFASGALLALGAIAGIRVGHTAARCFGLAGVLLAGVTFWTYSWLPEGSRSYAFVIVDAVGTLSVSLIIFSWPHLRVKAIERIVESNLVAIVAANAYALYLVHYPIMTALSSLLAREQLRPGTFPFIGAFLTMFLPAAVCATVSLHRFVEAPFLTMKERAREMLVAGGVRIAGDHARVDAAAQG